MKLQNNYILLSFATIVFALFLFLIAMPLFNVVDLRPLAINDPISFMIVNFSAYLLFLISFGFIRKCNSNFFYYKLMWMQEMLIILGFLGLGIGFVYMVLGMHVPPVPGVDPTAKLVASIAIAMITVIYGFFGAVVFYLIQKYYELKGNNNEKNDFIAPKEGFQLQPMIYFIIFLIVYFLACHIGALDAGVSTKNIVTSEGLIFIISINAIFIFMYKGNYLNLIKNIFWYKNEPANSIRYNLMFIRDIKKIASMIMTLILIVTPLIILASLGLDDNHIAIALVIENILIYYVYVTLLIVIINVIEAKEVGKLYLINGEISSGNRFFVITYILPPAVFLYVTLMITIYWTTLF